MYYHVITLMTYPNETFSMQISQVMTSYTQPIFDEKRYLSQFVSEMFDFLQ